MRSLFLVSAVTLVAGCAENKQPAAASSSSGGSSSSGTGTGAETGASGYVAPPVSTADGGADPVTGEIRYLALGDSFTIGVPSGESTAFPARLTERWKARGCNVSLQNYGVSGYTTQDVIQYALAGVGSFKPTFVTVAIGTNDIVKGVTAETYRTNVRQILEVARSGGARVIVLPQPEWPRTPTAASFGTPAALGEKRTAFDAILLDEAKAKGAEWIDLRLLMQQQGDQGLVSADNFHPSAEAYDAWAGELARVLLAPCAPR